MRELVKTDLHDGVATVSYNRPEKHNALSDAMSEEYRRAWRWALEEESARCIVLRGEGPSFSSGRDTTELGMRPEGMGDFDFVRQSQQWTFEALATTKPIVAAMKGYALGGGFERCLAADIRIAAADTVMGLPEIRYGLLPDTGGTQLLTTLVGPGRAKEMILTGRTIDAEEALAWGVVNRVVPPEELDEVVGAVAADIASRSPLAVAMGKQLVDQCWADQIQRGIRSELLAQTALFTSRDYAEARTALREARPAHFEGR